MNNKFSARLTGLPVATTRDALAREQDEFERRRRAGLLERRADEAGVPRQASLRRVAICEGLVETDAMRAVAEALSWRSGRGSEFGTQEMTRVVAGRPGTGKSAACARAVVRHPASSAYVTAVEIAATPRNAFSVNEERWLRWLDVDLLALDDAGTEGGDPGVIRTLLVQRHDAGRATFVTTNAAKGEFVKRYFDGRLADRLKGGQESEGLEWFVSVEGSSLRDPSALAALARKSNS